MQHNVLDFQAEFKAVSEDGKVGVFEGYGSIFGNKDSYNDIVAAGSFKESLEKNGLPAMLWQHNPDVVIGKYIEAREDQAGLFMRGEINLEVQQGREAYALLKQGALKGMSIGFITLEDEYDRESQVRTIKKVSLMEVSIVTFPANKRANVMNVKSELPKTEREFEKFLREAGYGRTEAKAIVSGGFKSYLSMQRDADEGADDVRREAELEHIKSSIINFNNVLKGLKHV